MLKLRPKHRRAAHMLAQGRSVADIATHLKLRPGTLARWRQQPAFIAEYEKTLSELAEEAALRRNRLTDKTIETLYKELDTYNSDPKVISAALNVLKSVLKEPELARNGPKEPETAPSSPA